MTIRVVNLGTPLKAPTAKKTLAERILSEAEVQKLIDLEPNSRNRVMLRLLYAAGLRVSELCNLHWRDLQARSEGEGQINVYGKGGKTRVVLLPATSWRELVSLREAAGFNILDVAPSTLRWEKRVQQKSGFSFTHNVSTS